MGQGRVSTLSIFCSPCCGGSRQLWSHEIHQHHARAHSQRSVSFEQPLLRICFVEVGSWELLRSAAAEAAGFFFDVTLAYSMTA